VSLPAVETTNEVIENLSQLEESEIRSQLSKTIRSFNNGTGSESKPSWWPPNIPFVTNLNKVQKPRKVPRSGFRVFVLTFGFLAPGCVPDHNASSPQREIQEPRCEQEGVGFERAKTREQRLGGRAHELLIRSCVIWTWPPRRPRLAGGSSARVS
jgi:hypothetical protein